MPYAANDRISDDEFPGSVYISKPAAARAIEAMVEGKRLEVHGKTVKLVDPEPIEPETPEPTAEEVRQRALGAIKHEAALRIHRVMSDVEQRNALAAQQTAMLAHGLDLNEWPDDLRELVLRNLEKWSEINRIRHKSNELEATDPLPSDPSDDKHWS